MRYYLDCEFNGYRGRLGVQLSTWRRRFAWLPVAVDAYTLSEMRNGKTRYRVWLCWVEYAFFTYTDDAGSEQPVVRYRLLRQVKRRPF